ncbi:phage protease [Desulfocastanea catecholica]
MNKKYRTSTAINSTEISPEGSGAPEWIQLIPAGPVSGRDGRAWNNSRPDMVLQTFVDRAMDLPIDIEHSTEHKGPKGEPAPAIGWVKELQNRNGEIWGRAEWTAAGRQMVDERAYRYTSPVILYQQDSGIIVGITSVAVTNQPNFKLSALNQQQGGGPPTKEDSMLKALLAALALSEDATEAEALAKIQELKTNLETAANRANNPSLEKFVPRADYEAAVGKASNAEQQLAELKKTELEKSVNSAIDQALKDGKITPATKEYHQAQCRQEGGLERFTAYCAAAPVIGDASGLDKKEPGDKSKALNAQEKEVCDNLGITEEEYLKAK